jgi:hypothetical protein
VAAVLLELAVSGRYSYQRDELYFLVCGQHLAFGYVDQPPLAPALARLSAELFGTSSLAGLRVIPALCLGLLVGLTAAMARHLGAGNLGRILAGLACATSSEYLAAAHVLTTTILDYSFWALTLYFTVGLLASQDVRWWPAIGLAVGVGLDAKWNVGFLVVGLVIALAVSGSRQLLFNRYALAAGFIAIGVGSPDLIWQALHGWPNIAVFRALQATASHNRVVFWPVQVTYTGIALTPVWIAGVVWCLRNPAAARFRALGVAAVLVLALVFAGGGKPYYCGGIFTVLFAAGAVPLEHFVSKRRGLRRSGVAAGAIVLSGLVFLPLAIPVLSARVLETSRLRHIAYPVDDANWPGLVRVVAGAYFALPGAERSSTTLLTGNYSQAGALDVLGRSSGLPVAYDGQNNYWSWGPPHVADRSVLAVGVDPDLLRRFFKSVRRVAVLAQSGIGYIGAPVPVYFATGLREPWPAAWPAFKSSV